MPFYQSKLYSFVGDARDFIYEPSPNLVLPISINWSPSIHNVEEQGQVNSCHDDQTEVLTSEGWKLFIDTSLKDKFATVDPVSKNIIFENPTRLIAIPHAGVMVVGDHKSLDFKVTPDHKMVVRKWVGRDRTMSKDYSFIDAKDLGGTSGLLTQVSWGGSSEASEIYTIPEVQHKHNSGKGSFTLPMAVWLKFLGIYLAEGTMLKRDQRKGVVSYKIQIAGVKEREKTFIREILNDMGLKFLELKDRFTFANKRLYEHLSHLGLEGIKAPSKFVPTFVFGQSAHNIKALLLGHFMGDGCSQREVDSHYTTSKKLADDLQVLLFLSGVSASLTTRNNPASVMKDGRVVTPNHKISRITPLGINRSVTTNNLTEEYYEGIVYCAEVPTYHTLVTRRNGKILISGNCTANAIVAGCEMVLKSNGDSVDLSRLFNYYESRKHGGITGDDGAYLRDAISAATKLGLPLESLWPYYKDLDDVPTADVYTDATTRKIDRYERINDGFDYIWDIEGNGGGWYSGQSIIGTPQYINDIKSALIEGYPVVIGLALSEDFQSITGDFEYQNNNPYIGVSITNPVTGNHAITIIGYDDAYQAFILLNSWGMDWGYKGLGLLKYETVCQVNEAWVIKGFTSKNLLSSSLGDNTSNNVTEDPGFSNTEISDVPLYSDSALNIPTLINGSQLLNVFNIITWVNVIYAKGFVLEATLKVAYLSSNNAIRFWIEETAGDTLRVVNQESILNVPTGAIDTSLKAYMLPIYSKSGAVLILKVDVASTAYLSFIQSELTPETRYTHSISEPLKFMHLISSITTLNSTVNRNIGISLFDNSYLQSFVKHITMPVSFTGYIHFLNSGFSNGMYVKQIKDALTGNLYLAVANGSNDANFGEPVLISKNTGTLDIPIYNYPPNPYLNIPTLKYYFNPSTYGYTNTITSPYPYLKAISADGSEFIFTTINNLVNKIALPKEVAIFDMGPHYIGLYKSGNSTNRYGLGSNISTEILSSSMIINTTQNITGVRVVSTGGITSDSLRLKQRSATLLGQTILQGDFPIFDATNRIYLSFSEGVNTDEYGSEVDITESGTYVIRSNLGGSLTIVTNRLLYNPYYNGVELLTFNISDADIFDAVTPSQVMNGSVEYKCIFIKNRNPQQPFYKISIWTDLNCNSPIGAIDNQHYLKFALNPNTSRDGTQLLDIASKIIAPIGINFNFANAESEALVINDLLPNQCVPIWIKRVVNSSQTITKQSILSYLRMKVRY